MFVGPLEIWPGSKLATRQDPKMELSMYRNSSEAYLFRLWSLEIYDQKATVLTSKDHHRLPWA
jgi:hypothetical protein